MMNRTGGSQDYGAARRKCEPHQALAGDFKLGLAVGSNFHDAPGSSQRCRYVEIAICVKGKTLGPAQSLVKRADGSIGLDFEHAVVRSSDEEVAMRPKSQMVGGDAHFESGEDERLLIARDFKDRAIPVTYVKTLLAIKGYARGDSQTLGKGCHRSVGSDAIDSAEGLGIATGI